MLCLNRRNIAHAEDGHTRLWTPIRDLKLLAHMTLRNYALQQERVLAGLAPSSPEANDLLSVLAPVIELGRSDKLAHRQVQRRWLQVLAECKDVNTYNNKSRLQ